VVEKQKKKKKATTTMMMTMMTTTTTTIKIKNSNTKNNNNKYVLFYVRILCSVATCKRRIETRDTSRHQVSCSDDKIATIHQTTELLDWSWDL